MSLPKRIFPDKQLYVKKEGSARVDELLAMTDEFSTNLPQAVGIYNIDEAFIKLVTSGDLSITIEGEQVPVIMLGNERWAEYGKIWKYVNEDKNITPPFITIKRASEAVGTMLGKRYTIANKRVFTYKKIPTFRDGIKGYDLYQIPEPTAIDITYEISMFTHMLEDVNTVVANFVSNYSDCQLYINVHGHYFPTKLEAIGSEDTQEDVDGDRYYVKTFTVLCMAYIQSTEDMKVIPAINRVIISGEISEEQFFRISQQIDGPRK